MAQMLTYKGTPHEPDEPILDVEGLMVTFASLGNGFGRERVLTHVLDDVSFQAEVGEQIAIIGPNGAGKSTLLKVVAGILTPDSGTVKMFGHAPDKHLCIAYVPQRNDIDWHFPATVSDVVMMGRTKQIGLFRRAGKRDRAIVRDSLERVKATHLASKQIGELSGGQQQRVFIARALAMDANLILMDEPLAGLDIPSQESLWEILDSLRKNDGVTILLATHDLGMAASRFDRVMLLNKKIIAFGAAEDVLMEDNLQNAYGGVVRIKSLKP